MLEDILGRGVGVGKSQRRDFVGAHVGGVRRRGIGERDARSRRPTGIRDRDLVVDLSTRLSGAARTARGRSFLRCRDRG